MQSNTHGPSKIEVLLEPDLETFVKEKVRAGQYANVSELVNEMFRLLRDHEEALMPTDPAELAELRRKIAVGIEQLDRGEGIELESASLGIFFGDIKARGRERLRTKRPEK